MRKMEKNSNYIRFIEGKKNSKYVPKIHSDMRHDDNKKGQSC
jgi:hypothetical protein